MRQNAYNPYEEDGYEITDPNEYKTRHFLKKYLINSEKINNEHLEKRIRAIKDKSNSQLAIAHKASLNLNNQLRRDTKMLDNYDKY